MYIESTYTSCKGIHGVKLKPSQSLVNINKLSIRAFGARGGFSLQEVNIPEKMSHFYDILA